MATPGGRHHPPRPSPPSAMLDWTNVSVSPPHSSYTPVSHDDHQQPQRHSPPRGAAVELRRASVSPVTSSESGDEHERVSMLRGSPNFESPPAISAALGGTGLHLRAHRPDSPMGQSAFIPTATPRQTGLSSTRTPGTSVAAIAASKQCGPPPAACSCSCLGRQLFDCALPRLSHLPGCSCFNVGPNLPHRHEHGDGKQQRRTSWLGVWALLLLTLLAALQVLTIYLAVHGVQDEVTGERRAVFSSLFGASSTAAGADVHLSASASLAAATVALLTADPHLIERLNASTFRQISRAERLEKVMGNECLRQLKSFGGWTDEQLQSETLLARAMSPWSGDPVTGWTPAQKEAWGMMGCLDRVLAPRARDELRRDYQGLVKRIAADELRREKLRNETYKMERGKFSLAHRREGECGSTLRCVIALSLYGSSTRYTLAVQSSVIRLPRIFPGWELRVYYDHTVPPVIMQKLFAHVDLQRQGSRHDLAKLELINVTSVWPVGSPELGRITGAFYRFLVADDLSVDRWLSRDCDAVLLERDHAAVQEWMGSGWTWHTMADFPQHGNMLAGMWGAVNYARSNGTYLEGEAGGVVGTPRPKVSMVQDAFGGRTMQQLIEDYTLSIVLRDGAAAKPKEYGVDQWFQTAVIWPVLQQDYMGHDSYHCASSRNSFSFPLPRPDPYMFIGQTHSADEDGRTEMDGPVDWRMEPDWEIGGKRPAPVECRRKPEWIYG